MNDDTMKTPPTATVCEKILEWAKAYVCEKREADYGSPEENFQVIADLWTCYLRTMVQPIDVANMMMLLKIARMRSGRPTMDSFIDVAGYAACGGEILSNSPGSESVEI